jgi:hypothetical protein
MPERAGYNAEQTYLPKRLWVLWPGGTSQNGDEKKQELQHVQTAREIATDMNSLGLEEDND